MSAELHGSDVPPLTRGGSGATALRTIFAVLLGSAALAGGVLVFAGVDPLVGASLIAAGFAVGLIHLVLGLMRRTELRWWILAICLGLVLTPVVYFGLAAINLVMHGWGASESGQGATTVVVP